MLQLDNVTRRFGERVAVSDATLSVPGGQMVGITGRSGAGKFTLLRMVNRLIEPTAGRVLFDGRDITVLSGRAVHDWRASAAMIFQQFNLVPRLDVLTNVLAGGQQQRVAIARALMQEPRILLADEPIASLDPMNAKMVMDALRDINRYDGITVLCNLHTLDTARAYCDRIVGMAQGRIVFDGAPDALTEDAVREIYGTTEHDIRLHQGRTRACCADLA